MEKTKTKAEASRILIIKKSENMQECNFSELEIPLCSGWKKPYDLHTHLSSLGYTESAEGRDAR